LNAGPPLVLALDHPGGRLNFLQEREQILGSESCVFRLLHVGQRKMHTRFLVAEQPAFRSASLYLLIE
jgi:hypothetical protein